MWIRGISICYILMTCIAFPKEHVFPYPLTPSTWCLSWLLSLETICSGWSFCCILHCLRTHARIVCLLSTKQWSVPHAFQFISYWYSCKDNCVTTNPEYACFIFVFTQWHRIHSYIFLWMLEFDTCSQNLSWRCTESFLPGRVIRIAAHWENLVWRACQCLKK